MKRKILFDLHCGMYYRYNGILQDNLLILKLLTSLEDIEVIGLLHSKNPFNKFHHKHGTLQDQNLMRTNMIFHSIINSHAMSSKKSFLSDLRNVIYRFTNKKSNLFPIDKKFNPIIWRNFLDKILSVKDRELFLEKQFLYFKEESHSSLNTSGYHYIILPRPLPMRVTSGTIKIVRYHDAIPILNPDVVSPFASYNYYRELLLCRKDSIFICNSDSSRQGLINIFPDLENKSLTIPCILPPNYKRNLNFPVLKHIIFNRLSSLLLNESEKETIRNKIQNEQDEINYILSVAILDPRKNHIRLISAWEKMNLRNEKRIKLLFVANPGWMSTSIENAMKPHVKNGDLIHLENLTMDEMSYIYSHAKLFVYPSYDEGFGLPPMEAMQCGCPTVVSDIPTHRSIMGNAAIYCDPYETDSITEKMEQLLYSNQADTMQKDLIAHGYKQVQLYTLDKIKPNWANLFVQLSQTHKKRKYSV